MGTRVSRNKTGHNDRSDIYPEKGKKRGKNPHAPRLTPSVSYEEKKKRKKDDEKKKYAPTAIL